MAVPLVDWERVDAVLLDMDGTLLDLAFDNHFWLEHVPLEFARSRGIGMDAAREVLYPRMNALRGTLDWYCVDFWSRETGLDIIALKTALADRIRVHDGVVPFLEAVRAGGRRLALVTNAHQKSIDIKLARTGIGVHFDELVSSHYFGAPKETEEFWPRLIARLELDPARCLFVDDSVPVLEAARDFGIGQVLAATAPDSRQRAKPHPLFPGVESFAELMPVPGRGR